VVKLILKRFNAGLSALAARAEFHGKVAHLDVTDIGTKRTDWHDEIHLDGPNAAKVADRFRAELRRRLAGPVPESGIKPSPLEPVAGQVRQQAETLAAFDQATLLRELDMRVALVEMDPAVAKEAQLAPLVFGRPTTEIGLTSLRHATRRQIRNWEGNLRDLICGGQADNSVEAAILEAVAKGKVGLSGAIAGWLVTGPLAVPAVLAGALAAWLASKVLALGQDRLCSAWQPDGPAAPPVMKGTIETATRTVGDMRRQFETPAGDATFSSDEQKTRLEQIDVTMANEAVEKPFVPVDAEGAAHFRRNAATIYRLLGGEPDDVPVDDAHFGTAEAMVLLDGSRPALYVRDGFVDLTDPKLVTSGWLDRITENEGQIRDAIKASGRIIRGPDRSADQVYGSAWMLDDGPVATARHVLAGC